MKELEMIELKEDIGQLTEELAFLTSTIAAKLKAVNELDNDIKHFDIRRGKVTAQLIECQNKLSGLLGGIK